MTNNLGCAVNAAVGGLFCTTVAVFTTILLVLVRHLKIIGNVDAVVLLTLFTCGYILIGMGLHSWATELRR